MTRYIFLLVPLLCCFAQCNNADNISETKDSTVITAHIDSNEHTNVADDTTTYKTFEGAWFSIHYPATFTAKPILKSLTSSEGYDSAIFTSPDGKVKFYVFSPQWSGNPPEIGLKDNEIILDSASKYDKDSTLIKHWTIEAKDKSYKRSYQETKLKYNVNWITGIEYSDSAAYNQYRNQYIHFKSSLAQFAD